MTEPASQRITTGAAGPRRARPLAPPMYAPGTWRRATGLWLALALGSSGCGDEASRATSSPVVEPAPPPDSPASPTPRSPPPDAPPTREASAPAHGSEDTEPPRAEGATPSAPSPANGAAPGNDTTPTDAVPPGACERVERSPIEVMPERGAPGLSAGGAALWVAGYRHEGEREWVQVMRVEGRRAHLEAELPVVPPLTQSRHAAPAVLHDGGRVVVAYTDGRGRLLVSSPGATPTLITALADIRLSPTLAKVAGGYAVTFTDSNGPTPRAILVRLSATLARVGEHVLHPDYMGGTAPFLVREPDGSAHRVAFADPRRGLSSILLADLQADGTPRGEPRTVSVVSQLSDPARVVMVEARDAGRLHIGFTAVDARGATAVGHLYSDGPSNPRPLIPDRGYGILDLDGLGLPHGALFVVDSPLGDPDSSPRELVCGRSTRSTSRNPSACRAPTGPRARGVWRASTTAR